MAEFKKLKKGERDVKYAPNIMALKWHDKKDVYMITTMHKDQMGPTEKIDRSTGLPKMKPECVIDYNEHMGIVDLNDMMLSSLQSIRKKSSDSVGDNSLSDESFTSADNADDSTLVLDESENSDSSVASTSSVVKRLPARERNPPKSIVGKCKQHCFNNDCNLLTVRDELWL
ncbi:hypothetical protein HF086_003113 [Spodoptera exigua]|uniref:PiggyBac transposable element-derived protein domain-containing protein n=1 Tax=Spodoptera exigua TaxID=7107 RepID=A0A922SP96_SPOEX|nr:hypothetical protein HF086_003113 [Spodoptera exigua]